MIDGDNVVPDAPEQRLSIELAGGMLLTKWCEVVGISKRTAMRWHQAGRLSIVHRNGMMFVSAAAIRDFFQDDGSRSGRGGNLNRAMAG